MKITIEASFYTDGDYRIDGYVYPAVTISSEKDIKLPDRQFKIYMTDYAYHEFESYHFIKTFGCEDSSYCQIYARSYLETLLCNIRFVGTHYYMIPYFYEMFDKGIKSIGHTDYFYDSIGGNYDGTDLEIKIE